MVLIYLFVFQKNFLVKSFSNMSVILFIIFIWVSINSELVWNSKFARLNFNERQTWTQTTNSRGNRKPIELEQFNSFSTISLPNANSGKLRPISLVFKSGLVASLSASALQLVEICYNWSLGNIRVSYNTFSISVTNWKTICLGRACSVHARKNCVVRIFYILYLFLYLSKIYSYCF